MEFLCPLESSGIPLGIFYGGATRILPELKGLSYGERLKSLKLPTMHHRRKRYDLIQLFKIVHGYEDIEPEKFFEGDRY